MAGASLKENRLMVLLTATLWPAPVASELASVVRQLTVRLGTVWLSVRSSAVELNVTVLSAAVYCARVPAPVRVSRPVLLS